MDHLLLLAGGTADPCLRLLSDCCTRKGVPYVELFHDADREPAVSFDLRNGQLSINGRCAQLRSAFIRMDAFSAAPRESIESLPKSAGWFVWALGVVSALPSIRIFNRSMSSMAGIKLADLQVARSCGLPVPDTLVSNEVDGINRFARDYGGAVAKPVNGGGYCKSLPEALDPKLVREGKMPIPAFVQERLSYPEYRVYRIGRQFMAFTVESAQLDYRVSTESTVRLVKLEAEPLAREMESIRAMTEILGLDFCAFDLKTREDGRLCFLEVNTGPMFAAHDRASNGRLTETIVEELWLA